MADASSATSDKYEKRLTDAVDALRGNVKWTLLAFGAIGTTLLAGSQLSNLGKFGWEEPRLWIALVFAVIALCAAAIAVNSALKVAYAGYTELYNLDPADVTYVESNAALLQGFGTIKNLRDAYAKCIAERHAVLTAREKDQVAIASYEIWFGYLDRLVDQTLSYIRHEKVRREAEKSRALLTGASTLAAIGVVGFAWAANPASNAQTVLLQSPASPAKLTLNATGKATLTPLLGAKCVALPIDVLLLNVSTSGSEVVTVAGKDCPLARFTLTGTMGKFASAAGTAPLLPAASTAAERSIVWAQVRPDGGGSSGELLARAIVARDAPCPALTVKGTSWPMQTRADGSDPDFPVRYCETALPGDSEAVIGGVKLKPRPSVLRRIVVIGDTGCRVTDYTAQQCDSAADWPFFRIAKSASATNPDLVIHVGDYHYREKPCAGRTGCTDSPSGDNWPTWDADFFKPAAPLLTAAPWLMLRGNHEDCSRAGAGWNLLIRPSLGKPSERCPAETDPDLFGFDRLRMIVPDTASAEGYGREGRVVTYRRQIRALPRSPGKTGDETWLLTHQALAVSYGRDKAGSYDADDMFSRVPETLEAGLRVDICNATISPMNTYRQWLAGTVPETNPNDDRPGDQRAERPCLEKTPAKPLAAPDISLVISGDTHTFQMFAPDQAAEKNRPIQLIIGNGGDNLESSKAYPGSDKALLTAAANLFGVPGKLWMRNTFGFAVLEKPEGTTAWTATLHDLDGKVIAQCSLGRSNAECKDK